MTYRERYGAPDPRGRGPLATLLGDPSKFGDRRALFAGGGAAYWWVVADDNGNPWYVITKGANGETYDGPSLAKRSSAGFAPIVPTFERVESDLAAAVGVDV